MVCMQNAANFPRAYDETTSIRIRITGFLTSLLPFRFLLFTIAQTCHARMNMILHKGALKQTLSRAHMSIPSGSYCLLREKKGSSWLKSSAGICAQIQQTFMFIPNDNGSRSSGCFLLFALSPKKIDPIYYTERRHTETRSIKSSAKTMSIKKRDNEVLLIKSINWTCCFALIFKRRHWSKRL